ncbi:MAG: hypothetical protein V4615_15710 [Bacteroidota bacterium]
MPRHKTIVQFLFGKLLQVYCPYSKERSTYSKRFCCDELMFNISEKLNISITLIPGDEVLFHALGGIFCSEATEEKAASLFYCCTDTEHRDEELQYYLQICKRKQITSKPRFQRFVKEFFGEAENENHLPHNLNEWMQSLTPEETLRLFKAAKKKVEKLKVNMKEI